MQQKLWHPIAIFFLHLLGFSAKVHFCQCCVTLCTAWLKTNFSACLHRLSEYVVVPTVEVVKVVAFLLLYLAASGKAFSQTRSWFQLSACAKPVAELGLLIIINTLHDLYFIKQQFFPFCHNSSCASVDYVQT